jgi:cobalt-zinc-cadmium efflux system protein
VLVNAGCALLFARGRERDVNQRGAFLHLVADAAVSGGVVIAGLLVWQTGWAWVDPAASLMIGLVIVVSTIRLLREALDLLLDAVPSHIDPVAVERYLAELPGVLQIHDLHIWPTSSSEVALTAHVVVEPEAHPSSFVHDVTAEIAQRFGIAHATLQLEPASGECVGCL